MTTDEETTARIDASPVTTILVLTDFSDCSLAGVRYAVRLARLLGAKLLVLHVTEPVQAGAFLKPGEGRAWRGKLKQHAMEALGQLVRREVPEGVRARTYVRAGRSWETIVAFARRSRADLVVIATHGYTGLKHALLGSVAERVVRHAPCPVLTVRSETKR